MPLDSVSSGTNDFLSNMDTELFASGLADETVSAASLEGEGYGGTASLPDEDVFTSGVFDFPQGTLQLTAEDEGSILAQVPGQSSPIDGQPSPVIGSPGGGDGVTVKPDPTPTTPGSDAGASAVLNGARGLGNIALEEARNRDFEAVTPEVLDLLEANPGQGVLLRYTDTKTESYVTGSVTSYNRGSLEVVAVGGTPAEAFATANQPRFEAFTGARDAPAFEESNMQYREDTYVFIEENADKVSYANPEGAPENLVVGTPSDLERFSQQGWSGIYRSVFED